MTIWSNVVWIIHAAFFSFLFFQTRWAAAITADGPLNQLPAFDLLGGDALSLSPPGLCVRVWPPQSTRSHNFSSALLSSGCRFPARSCWLPSSPCFVSLLEVWPHQTLHTADAHISTHGWMFRWCFLLCADPWMGSKLTKYKCVFIDCKMLSYNNPKAQFGQQQQQQPWNDMIIIIIVILDIVILI